MGDLLLNSMERQLYEDKLEKHGANARLSGILSAMGITFTIVTAQLGVGEAAAGGAVFSAANMANVGYQMKEYLSTIREYIPW
jgi:hypothetical protein